MRVQDGADDVHHVLHGRSVKLAVIVSRDSAESEIVTGVLYTRSISRAASPNGVA
jgi:hypothetical protein